jgi:glycosyltransferase involved in cell wall biosynthesis
MKKEKYLIFIPTFYAAKTVKKVMLNLKSLKLEFDVLVVDNHSEDNTPGVVRDTIKKYRLENYTIIRNIRNLDYGGSMKIALFYGIYNNYDKLIVIHADNQYPVNHIPKLIEHNLRTKAAMTIGTRLKHKNVKRVMPKWRYISNYLLSAMNRWAYELELDEFNSEYRIYDLHFIKKVNIDRCSNMAIYTIDSIREIIAKKGLINQIVIPCYYPPDAHHPSLLILSKYLLDNIYRAIKFKLFNR